MTVYTPGPGRCILHTYSVPIAKPWHFLVWSGSFGGWVIGFGVIMEMRERDTRQP